MLANNVGHDQMPHFPGKNGLMLKGNALLMSTKHDITGLYTTLCNSPFKLKDELCGENSALLNLSMILLFALGLRVGGN